MNLGLSTVGTRRRSRLASEPPADEHPFNLASRQSLEPLIAWTSHMLCAVFTHCSHMSLGTLPTLDAALTDGVAMRPQHRHRGPIPPPS